MTPNLARAALDLSKCSMQHILEDEGIMKVLNQIYTKASAEHKQEFSKRILTGPRQSQHDKTKRRSRTSKKAMVLATSAQDISSLLSKLISENEPHNLGGDSNFEQDKITNTNEAEPCTNLSPDVLAGIALMRDIERLDRDLKDNRCRRGLTMLILFHFVGQGRFASHGITELSEHSGHPVPKIKSEYYAGKKLFELLQSTSWGLLSYCDDSLITSLKNNRDISIEEIKNVRKHMTASALNTAETHTPKVVECIKQAVGKYHEDWEEASSPLLTAITKAVQTPNATEGAQYARNTSEAIQELNTTEVVSQHGPEIVQQLQAEEMVSSMQRVTTPSFDRGSMTLCISGDTGLSPSQQVQTTDVDLLIQQVDSAPCWGDTNPLSQSSPCLGFSSTLQSIHNSHVDHLNRHEVLDFYDYSEGCEANPPSSQRMQTDVAVSMPRADIIRFDREQAAAWCWGDTNPDSLQASAHDINLDHISLKSMPPLDYNAGGFGTGCAQDLGYLGPNLQSASPMEAPAH